MEKIEEGKKLHSLDSASVGKCAGSWRMLNRSILDCPLGPEREVGRCSSTGKLLPSAEESDALKVGHLIEKRASAKR